MLREYILREALGKLRSESVFLPDRDFYISRPKAVVDI